MLAGPLEAMGQAFSAVSNIFTGNSAPAAAPAADAAAAPAAKAA